MSKAANTRESMAAEAERRRNLEGNTLFENLGDPIKKLLLQIHNEVSNEKLKLLSKITVRQLAKVYDMLSMEEDPEKILAWLEREAMKAMGQEPDKVKKKSKIQTGSNRDAIAFYKELETKNIAMMEQFQKNQDEREQLRSSNIAERRKRRDEAQAKAAADRERAAAAGETVDAVATLKKQDAADIAGVFDRATKNTAYDNSSSNQDTEWWKKDEFRRDFEKNGKKAKTWTRVIEGGSQQIPEAEMAAREEWYRSQCWWKADKYRRDWLASRDAEWWKEESYIRDWQDNGDSGRMWTAADELSGFNRKGEKRPATKAELDRRVQWYKDNGPKGIVKAWCGLTEGSGDRCTLEEKRERDDYFKNGDWWKQDTFARKIREDPSSCEAIKTAGAAGEDREWWKDDEYRRDFMAGGTLWKAVSEQNAVQNGGELPTTEAEAEKRAEWFKEFWWKADKYRDDFAKNGANGKLWKSLNEEESDKSSGGKQCRESEAKIREAWFKSADDREWWKDEAYINDWQENGTKGARWNAAFKEAGIAGEGEEAKANADELKKREEWFAKNWWKTDKFVKDFQHNGKRGMAWKAGNPDVAKNDTDWWKQGDFQKEWSASKRNDVTPFWQSPECIEDYLSNGTNGKKWIAKDAAYGSVGKGDLNPAAAEDLAAREEFYKNNWWRTPECAKDFAANGKSGKKWTATVPGGDERASPAMIKARQEFFAPKAMNKTNPGFASMLEADAEGRARGEFATPDEIAKREDTLKKTWWKSPAVIADYQRNGDNSTLLKAATPEAAMMNLTDDPAYQASPEEIAARKQWLEGDKNDDEWWADDAYRQELSADQEPVFWKNPEYIDDYLKNGSAGKKWTAAHAAAGSIGKGDEVQATPEELAQREEWLKKNFWKSPEYKKDFEENGVKGTKWTTSEPNGKGTPLSDGEMRTRADFYKPKAKWQLAEKPEEKERVTACDPADAIDREEWFKKNWWKSPEVREDYKLNGKNSKLLKAATHEVAMQGKGDDPNLQATPEEIEERIKYFEDCEDEWWKNPSVVDDYNKNGAEGAIWPSRTFKESEMSMGKEVPCNPTDQSEREEWYANNYWKGAEAIEDFASNGNKGKKWNVKKDGSPVSDAELKEREEWYKKNAPCDSEEEKRRKEWFQQQLNDEERVMRRQWMVKQIEESKKIHKDELADVLTGLNAGEKPSDDQLKAIEDAIRARRIAMHGEDAVAEDEGITQEEFVTAVAETEFYVPQTDEERMLAEQEALEALQAEEMSRLEEEAAFIAMEIQEEKDAAKAAAEEAGEEYVDEDAAAEEEAAALAAMEEEEANQAAPINEDDVVNEGEDEAWQDFLNNKNAEDEELSADEQAELERQEEEEKLAAAKLEEANNAAWESEEIGGDEGEEADGEATLDEDQKEELEAVIEENEGWGEEDGEEWVEEQEEEEIDEIGQEEKGQPMQWKLPLREVTNPQFLKAYFTVIKYTPSHSLLGGKQKRVWVVDHFTRCFYNLEKSGKIRKEHAANKLLQLERNVLDANRLRLMFFDAAHSYELQFFNPQERERFYETASAIRPSIRVYAPDLTNQDASVEACTTTIDGVGPESVSVTCNNAAGKPVQRELTGECKVNASKLLTEPLTIWTGTFNLSGHRPPRNGADLDAWMPKDKYDLYAVAVQEASYCKSESEWFEYVQQYLGKDYLTLASMNLWDTMLIVLTRKKHLLKITNVEGSTKATVHKAVCGTKGGIGISLRYLETSICFVTCHLAARLERNQMRNTNLEEVVDCLQLGIRETDFCNQFNHVFFFGDFNYRVELDAAGAQSLIDSKDYAQLQEYDQLNQQRAEEGILNGFQEPPITFAPTYRMQTGTGNYQAEKGNAPSYCDRVLTRSMANTWVKCTAYKSAPAVTCSEHQPVCATFIVRCVRPVMSCFMKQQTPIPRFVMESVNFAESTGPIIKKPTLLVCTPFSQLFKPVPSKASATATPAWDSTNIPPIDSVSQCQEYLETCHMILVVREGAEKREDKAHRGTALITLFGRVIGVEGVQQEFESDVMCHGKSIGKITGKFHWDAIPN